MTRHQFAGYIEGPVLQDPDTSVTRIVRADFAATPPFVDLTNSENRGTIIVSCRAILNSQLHIHTEVRTLTRRNDNTYRLELPTGTRMIRLTVNGNEEHLSWPASAKPVFDSPDLWLMLLLHHCNTVSVDTSGLDHKAVQPGETRTFGHQLGPLRAARAMGIVHIAMFEAYLMFNGGYDSYVGLPRSSVPVHGLHVATKAAVLQATYSALVSLFPSHSPRLNDMLEQQMLTIPDSVAKTQGIMGGTQAAMAILSMRQSDGSSHAEPIVGQDYFLMDVPGEWQPDPVSNIQVALGASWSAVTPFVVQSASQFRCAPPPPLASTEYMMMYDEAKAMGGDGVTTPTVRSQEKTEIGLFWAYDGTPSLCAPPRLYNQLVMQILCSACDKMSGADIFRTVAVINVLMADTALCCWESKYHYKFWRPITAIPLADTDGNPGTVAMPSWLPLGAPASNLSSGVNFTPPFPTYPSGHATFCASVCELLRLTLGSDDIDILFVSDEFNGHTLDASGEVRPYRPRYYSKITHIDEENGDSRIYLGIHFTCDKTSGQTMGHDLADYVNARLFVPSP